MTFISYAQNFEDVMLWRALKHIQNGVYVDVGAQHPVNDSVSKAFYEHGWRGIHFEPVPYYAELLRQDRPDEVVLEVALSDIEGTLELNVIAETGLSTAVDAYAQRHHSEWGLDSQKIQVPVLTLKSALHSLEGKDVHWLKIDVEGLEEKVLKGWDNLVLRPWVMVVEATIPNLPEVDFANWEPILIAADYQFVYFDGLNRFYVAKEHNELVEAFSCPPNVFDDFELRADSHICKGLIASHQASEAELAAEQQKAESLAAQLSQVNKQNEQLQLNGEQLNNHSQWLQKECDASKLSNEQLQTHSQWLQQEWDASKLSNEQLQAHSQWLQKEWDAFKLSNEQLQAYSQCLQKEWDAANVKINELEQERKNLYASSSWRITKPLRLLSLGVSKLFNALLYIPKGIWWVIKWPFKLILSGLIRYAIKRSAIQSGIRAWLRNYPKLYTHSLLFAQARGINIGAMTSTFPINKTQNTKTNRAQKLQRTGLEEDIDLTSLSPRTRRIYLDLKKTMDSNNKENS